MANLKSNFYEILNASSSNATIDELKSNYKQLILQCHPDKLQQQEQQEQEHLETKTNKKLENNDDDPNNLEFVSITKAWNCLRDPMKRKQYDAELLLNKFHTHNNIYARIKLNEMKKQPSTRDYYQYYEEEEEECQKKLEEEPNVKGCEENDSKYIYTYDCRCGGQYIVDESAQQFCRSDSNHTPIDTTTTTTKKKNDNNGDDEYNDAGNTTQNNNNDNKNRPNNLKTENSSGGGGGGGGGGDGAAAERVLQDNSDDEEGGELIVECSECSLVIILNG